MSEAQASQEKTSGWRWGVNRWIVLGLIILGVYFAGRIPPMLPHIQLPAEALTGVLFTLPVIGEFQLTNTIVAVLIADVVLILLAFIINRAASKGSMVLSGIPAAVEAIIEALWNLTESTAGKWAKSIFPISATIFLLVLVVNWTELFPGVDSIGLLDEHHIPIPEACQFDTLLRLGGTEIVGVTGEDECASGVIPFVRVTSTDLNFTVALALISVVMTQVIGVRALGRDYWKKFFNPETMFTRPMFGLIDLLVSLLEAILEGAKVLSFSFRLFGNIFAGSILLFVIGNLIPAAAQSGVLLFEFVVGMLQAFIFAFLTLIFMSLATVSHSDEAH